jgi:hypothetical protein
MTLDRGRRCKCGNYGCLEARVGPPSRSGRSRHWSQAPGAGSSSGGATSPRHRRPSTTPRNRRRLALSGARHGGSWRRRRQHDQRVQS